MTDNWCAGVTGERGNTRDSRRVPLMLSASSAAAVSDRSSRKNRMSPVAARAPRVRIEPRSASAPAVMICTRDVPNNLSERCVTITSSRPERAQAECRSRTRMPDTGMSGLHAMMNETFGWSRV